MLGEEEEEEEEEDEKEKEKERKKAENPTPNPNYTPPFFHPADPIPSYPIHPPHYHHHHPTITPHHTSPQPEQPAARKKIQTRLYFCTVMTIGGIPIGS